MLLEPGYVLEDESNDRAEQLRENGRVFYDERYRGHFDNLIGCTGDWVRAIGEDPLNKRFGEDCARLTRDCLLDSEGALKWKPELWMDVRKVILPSLIENVGCISSLD